MIQRIAKKILSQVCRIHTINKKEWRPETIKRVLILALKPLGIGDLIMNTPALRELKRAHPDWHITLATHTDLGHTHYDELILHKNGPLSLRKKVGHYDLIILPNKNLLQSIAALRVPHTYIIGYIRDWNVRANFALEKRYSYLPTDHYYTMAFNATRALGVDSITPTPAPLKVSLRTLNATRKQLAHLPRPVITINPRVLWKSRTWPAHHYQELIARLLKEKNGILIVGGPDDIPYNKQFDTNHPHYLNLTGTTSLNELAALFLHSDAIISADCGPMHIALSVNKPVITLWGPTHPATRLPPSALPLALYHPESPGAGSYDMENEPTDTRAIESITINEVYEKIQETLCK